MVHCYRGTYCSVSYSNMLQYWQILHGNIWQGQYLNFTEPVSSSLYMMSTMNEVGFSCEKIKDVCFLINVNHFLGIKTEHDDELEMKSI